MFWGLGWPAASCHFPADRNRLLIMHNCRQVYRAPGTVFPRSCPPGRSGWSPGYLFSGVPLTTKNHSESDPPGGDPKSRMMFGRVPAPASPAGKCLKNVELSSSFPCSREPCFRGGAPPGDWGVRKRLFWGAHFDTQKRSLWRDPFGRRNGPPIENLVLAYSKPRRNDIWRSGPLLQTVISGANCSAGRSPPCARSAGPSVR